MVLVCSAEIADAEGEVEVPHAVAGQAHHQQTRPFQPVRHFQANAPPWVRMWPKTVLNAFTTCALAGAALAIYCAAEVSSGVASPLASAFIGLVMSTMTLPA